jgi:hypothetical protein
VARRTGGSRPIAGRRCRTGDSSPNADRPPAGCGQGRQRTSAQWPPTRPRHRAKVRSQFDRKRGRAAVDAGRTSRSSEIGSVAAASGTPRRDWPRSHLERPRLSLTARSRRCHKEEEEDDTLTRQLAPAINSLSPCSAAFSSPVPLQPNDHPDQLAILWILTNRP